MIQTLPNGFHKNSSENGGYRESKADFKKNWGITETHRIALYLASESSHNQRGLEALSHLFSDPEIKSRWSLLVVGNIKLSGHLPKSIIPCGIQNQLFSFFKGSDIALNPVISGSGSNVKLIECLGNGLAVLTTPFGARGFNRSLKGLSIEPLGRFKTRLLSQPDWNLPDPDELMTYEWTQIGNQLFELLDSSLQSKEKLI